MCIVQATFNEQTSIMIFTTNPPLFNMLYFMFSKVSKFTKSNTNEFNEK